jgi:hypothetical protein
MYHQLCLRLGFLLVLLSIFCYSSSVNRNLRQAVLLSTVLDEPLELIDLPFSNKNNEIRSSNLYDELYYLKLLCALYGECDGDGQHATDYDDAKYKRLSSILLLRIPKFGKRIYSSPFSGISKFG